MEIIKKEHFFDGAGHVIFKHLLTNEQLNEKCRVYAEVTLEPGCEIGYHVHHGDAETFYILSGEGEFNDNGTVRIIKKGDVTYTPSDIGHSLINRGSANLVLMALIIYD
ncbi:MAG: cupin domain-containing protein [Megasphaera sp.]|jgi:quercetin dioxygenase-like cupin family protein|uniref:cupin domain-containing protein n=1 Tax=Megasphaera sueciensis TaxID=349094 RepID=UPI003D032575|nr:cupin domain-containing protein [Megasphaera sp.]MCI1823471.1 cupin domain-containing protein [Megasphaera sp.]